MVLTLDDPVPQAVMDTIYQEARYPVEQGVGFVTYVKLYLVRHGESAWNVKHFYTGQTDVPLSEVGGLQAERLAEKWHAVPFNAL